MSRRIINEFGVQIYGATIGDTWAGLVRAVLDLGSQCFDEDRERIALSNVRIKSSVQNYPDLTIEEHCNSDQLKAMLDFMFNTDTMEDIDVVKSFSRGAKSYHRRIKEGRMIEFVIERLSLIPESKKAVVVFPTYEDYAAVMRNHRDDYLPALFRYSSACCQTAKITSSTRRSIRGPWTPGKKVTAIFCLSPSYRIGCERTSVRALGARSCLARLMA